VVAWATYRILRPVNEGVSMLAAWLRVASAGIFMVAISQLVGILHLLGSGNDPAVLTSPQPHAQVLAAVNAFTDIWAGSLILFGLHLIVIGYLAYKSGYVPRSLAVLLVIAGLGYLCDSFGPVLSAGYSIDIKNFTFIGELLLAFWLLIRGRHITLPQSAAHEHQQLG
jgi:hypothetical protein